MLTASEEEIKYESCCWYTLGLLNIFCSLHCLDSYIPRGGIKLVISNVDLSNDDFTFYMKVDEYNEKYKFQGLFAFKAKTNGNKKIKNFVEQFPDKKKNITFLFDITLKKEKEHVFNGQFFLLAAIACRKVVLNEL